ncbi:MAG TPA: 4'-phosphopantetheinyl transferase superfamily protein [Puia sp.]
MEDKIKEIISIFTKIPVEQIGPATAIGRSTMQSSILLHRMYARLAEEGVTVNNYGDIRTFADLLPYTSDKALATNGQAPHSGTQAPAELPAGRNSFVPGVTDPSAPGIGIDIEEVAGLPRTHDFRKEAFYKMNFTADEIAYCILQPDPYASFTGLFAAKEAIIKADGRYRNKGFNAIEIGHSAEGKPVFPGLDLSISHAGTMAVAVAAPTAGSLAPAQTPGTPAGRTPAPGRNSRLAFWLAGLALALSAIALLLVFTHWHE